MPDIIHRIGIKAPVDQVSRALTTVEGIAGWWTEETTGSAATGGIVTVRFSDHGVEKGKMTIEVTRAALDDVSWRVQAGPPEWIGTDISFRLTQEGDMTLIIFGHLNWPEAGDFMGHCSMKWAVFLLSLRSLVETGRGSPAPRDLKIDNWN